MSRRIYIFTQNYTGITVLIMLAHAFMKTVHRCDRLHVQVSIDSNDNDLNVRKRKLKNLDSLQILVQNKKYLRRWLK